jgi:hypothetical protein
LKQNCMATLSSFPPSMMYKENWLYKTSMLSKINNRNLVCERKLVDST